MEIFAVSVNDGKIESVNIQFSDIERGVICDISGITEKPLVTVYHAFAIGIYAILESGTPPRKGFQSELRNISGGKENQIDIAVGCQISESFSWTEVEENPDVISTGDPVGIMIDLVVINSPGKPEICTVFFDFDGSDHITFRTGSRVGCVLGIEIGSPTEYIGGLMELCQERRGEYHDMKYLDANRAELHYTLPLNEIIYDFFDALKSRSKGYASLDYELDGYRPSKLVKLDFLLNGDPVDALSFIVHEEKAYSRARRIAEKLKDNIPRQLFEIPIQAAIGSKIIARETVKAMRKDVLAKCYGGDITRKKKLLEKQKEGKKKMRRLGSVEVTPEAFMAVLKLNDE